MMRKSLALLTFSIFGLFQAQAANSLRVGDAAPIFQATTHEGKPFDLSSRKGTWTVLFFYPKAGTPGCTEQACAFRDSVRVIREKGADVFGVSADTVQEQAEFLQKHKLTFTLLADPDMKAIKKYGTKMPLLSMSKRWTYILDPDLKIASVDTEVDPAADARRVAAQLEKLQSAKKN